MPVSRVLGVVVGSLLGLLSPVSAWAQEPASNPSEELAAAAEARGSEWSALAASLEQKVARMLPCDARVRSAIEEVSRASDARFAALVAVWRDAEAHAQEQTAIAGRLTADSNASIDAWKAERAEAMQEQTQIAAQSSDLRASARVQPALSSASNALDGIAGTVATAAKLAGERELLGAAWKTNLADALKASEARQAAMENEIKALGAESARWNAYYAARIVRAQTECSLTGASAGEPAPSRSKGAKGK